MQIKAMKISPVAGAALLAALMTATAPLSYAASDEEQAARRAQWESLSTQEREARRQERRGSDDSGGDGQIFRTVS